MSSGCYRCIISRSQVGLLKWRKASGMLCVIKFPLKLKEKFYKMKVRPAKYGVECWPLEVPLLGLETPFFLLLLSFSSLFLLPLDHGSPLVVAFIHLFDSTRVNASKLSRVRSHYFFHSNVFPSSFAPFGSASCTCVSGFDSLTLLLHIYAALPVI
ncbi:hypothetical protein KFK09_006992 [Dendrobium nobile]|uniref:Uncharacterized protein n=1 Tax=Dendrobium nobile TaxID=94219 RepID=A0A8T3BVK9_DENNO|nr:hypothetical protein KFK09_006992 [Dendrobium nobile]